MPITGKTGGDALWKAVHKALTVMAAYEPKFRITVGIMLSAGLLTVAEGEVILGFLASLSALVAALKKVADYTNVS